MKDVILKFLMENTELMHKYVGGGPEPVLIVFTNSELDSWTDEDKEAKLSVIAGYLTEALKEEGARMD